MLVFSQVAQRNLYVHYVCNHVSCIFLHLSDFVMYASGQGSSLIICVGILTGYTDTLYKMLSQLTGI